MKKLHLITLFFVLLSIPVYLQSMTVSSEDNIVLGVFPVRERAIVPRFSEVEQQHEASKKRSQPEEYETSPVEILPARKRADVARFSSLTIEPDLVKEEPKGSARSIKHSVVKRYTDARSEMMKVSQACQTKGIDALKVLIEMNPANANRFIVHGISTITSTHAYPIHIAAHHGNNELVKYLVKTGMADINKVAKKNASPRIPLTPLDVARGEETKRVIRELGGKLYSELNVV